MNIDKLTSMRLLMLPLMNIDKLTASFLSYDIIINHKTINVNTIRGLKI